MQDSSVFAQESGICCLISGSWFGRIQTLHPPLLVDVTSQIKYKESGKKEMSSSLYSALSDTSETSFAREMTDMQSEVKKDAACGR